jgi:dynein heavy chain, axonemal
VKDKVEALERETKRMMDEKEALEAKMAQSTARMGRAEKVVVALADEGVRWGQTVGVIQGKIDRLVGDIFISCACISYYGAFTGEYRGQLVEKWSAGCKERGIPFTEPFSLVSSMGDPVVVRSWGIAGLPSDQVSTENGILTTKAERYALCIDPQEQANKWIRTMEKDNSLMILKFGTDTFLREVTAAVKIGKPVLVADAEENIDPAIDPILLKQ